jgi:hypothetical protein
MMTQISQFAQLVREHKHCTPRRISRRKRCSSLRSTPSAPRDYGLSNESSAHVEGSRAGCCCTAAFDHGGSDRD